MILGIIIFKWSKIRINQVCEMNTGTFKFIFGLNRRRKLPTITALFFNQNLKRKSNNLSVRSPLNSFSHERDIDCQAT
jgi:hypothetical protein